MKAPYLKSGIFAVAAVLLCVAATVSCADDIVVGEWTDNGSLDGIHENNALLQDASTNKSDNSVELWNETYTTDLKLSFAKVPAEGFAARASFDAAYLETYNAKHGTDYLLYPAEKVAFSDNGMFSVTGRTIELSVSMTISGAADLEKGKTYLVPVVVTSQSPDVTIKEEAGHCVYIIQDMRGIPSCHKGEGLPKGFLFYEVNDANPLNTLAFELENGKLLWDVIVLFAGNIKHDNDANRPCLKNNPNVQFLLDNNEIYLQPLRKRGVKVLLGILGDHDQAGVAQLSDSGARDFAAELARYCEAYNIDGVNFDDEYSDYPDLNNPAYTSRSAAAAARLCYETKKAMPDKLVTVFSYGLMNIDYFPTEIEGRGMSKWVDVAVPNYGFSCSPRGDMSFSQCAGFSAEFNLGGSSGLNAATAQHLINNGYGWFMGFAPDPMKISDEDNQVVKEHWQNIFNRLSGAEQLYGSKLKTPTIFYKKNDPAPYRYPEELPERKE